MIVKIVPVSGGAYDDPFLDRANEIKKLLKRDNPSQFLYAARGDHVWQLSPLTGFRELSPDSLKADLEGYPFVESVTQSGKTFTVTVKVS